MRKTFSNLLYITRRVVLKNNFCKSNRIKVIVNRNVPIALILFVIDNKYYILNT